MVAMTAHVGDRTRSLVGGAGGELDGRDVHGRHIDDRDVGNCECFCGRARDRITLLVTSLDRGLAWPLLVVVGALALVGIRAAALDADRRQAELRDRDRQHDNHADDQ